MAKLEEAPAPRLEGEIATVTLGDARRIIAAAEKKAEEIGERMNIAVVDVGGNIASLCENFVTPTCIWTVAA